ncbi:MAG: 2-C-methyl-D-erythritol 4-phosphate cytidylyltransferase [Roseburia sp.]|nr:2-C-methyl-D-erythritol 4-phosphate cytidylyltransferase [Roseburia sp.]
MAKTELTEKRCTAVVLAAGSGSRMESPIAKQFLLLKDKPLIYYALRTIEASKIIDDCILVTGEEDISRVKREIVEKYEFHKVDAIIAGGKERYASVANAMRLLRQERMPVTDRQGYVFIHDGARPFLTEEILERTYQAVQEFHACVAAVPSKDTVKIADEQGFALETPARRLVWNIQTPQVFDTRLIVEAYARLEQKYSEFKNGVPVTDDASVVELFTDCGVKLVMGSYENIKITTPEDLAMAAAILG